MGVTGGAESEGVLPTSTGTYYGKAYTGGAESEGDLPTNTLICCGNAYTGGSTMAMHTQVALKVRGLTYQHLDLPWQCIHRWH